MGASDSINESLHNNVKAMIPKQDHYTSVVHQVLNFIKDINNRSTEFELQKFEIEEQFKIPSLRLLRKLTAKRVFNKCC